jgi:hypothetical protein
MSRMAVLILANGRSTFSKVMGFARAQPILRARLIIDNGTGAMYYTNNHYESFYPVTVAPPR